MPDDGTRVGGKRLHVRRADTVEQKPVDWLWLGRIPYGMITIIDGNPNLGKGFMTLWLAASVSIGRALPGDDRPREAANVFVLGAEDSAEKTTVPRLDAAGADLTRVYLDDAIDVSGERGKRPICFPDDFDAVRAFLIERQIALLLVDPIMAYLSEQVDSASDQAVRRVLHLLKELAEETNCAVVLVRHFNKNAGASAIHRGGGSIGIIGAARVGMMVEKMPGDDARRVLAIVKNNLAPPPPALLYEIVPSQARPGIGLIHWLGETAYTADELVSPTARAEAGKLEEAVAFLRVELAGGGLRPQGAILEAAKAAGIAKATLIRAKLLLRVESKRIGGVGVSGQWCWRLPDESVSESAADTVDFDDALSDSSE